MAAADLTVNRVRELFDYDPETGFLTRRISVKRNAVKAGTLVGGRPDRDGHFKVKIDTYTYKVHRVIWLHYYGHWPTLALDHINGKPSDNRIANLREATAAMNAQNVHRPRYSKKHGMPLGVIKVDDGSPRPYRAHIRLNGRTQHLGSFETPQAAHAVYLDAKRRWHIGCTI